MDFSDSSQVHRYRIVNSDARRIHHKLPAMIELLIVAIVFMAALIQTISGFGFALIVMPLLVLTLGIQIAAPLVALTGCALYAVNLARHHQSVNIREVVRLSAAAALGIPIGVWAIQTVDGELVRRVLGALLIGYALYSMIRPHSASVISSKWGYPAGFLAGCLGGAYNTAGPPVIVYGDSQQWARNEFRSVLQALFLFNALFVIAAHAVAGHLTPTIGRYLFFTIPALAIGILAGTADRPSTHDPTIQIGCQCDDSGAGHLIDVVRRAVTFLSTKRQERQTRRKATLVDLRG